MMNKTSNTNTIKLHRGATTGSNRNNLARHFIEQTNAVQRSGSNTQYCKKYIYTYIYYFKYDIKNWTKYRNSANSK